MIVAVLSAMETYLLDKMMADGKIVVQLVALYKALQMRSEPMFLERKQVCLVYATTFLQESQERGERGARADKYSC